MHEEQFPESQESPERRSARAVAALQYEERAQLGFRKRRHGLGDPWADPERHQIDRPIGNGELFGNYLAGIATALGAMALVTRPLALGFIAVVLALAGVIAGGEASRVGRIGLIVASFGFFFGMLFAIVTDRAILL